MGRFTRKHIKIEYIMAILNFYVLLFDLKLYYLTFSELYCIALNKIFSIIFPMLLPSPMLVPSRPRRLHGLFMRFLRWKLRGNKVRIFCRNNLCLTYGAARRRRGVLGHWLVFHKPELNTTKYDIRSITQFSKIVIG